MDSSATRIAKMALRIAGSLGAAKIVGAIIKNNVTPETDLQKAQIFVAKWAIAGIVGDKVEDYTNEAVDEALDFYHVAKEVVQKIKSVELVDEPSEPDVEHVEIVEDDPDTPETTGP